MQAWEIEQEALNAYCATLRRHKYPDALVSLHGRRIREAIRPDSAPVTPCKPAGGDAGFELGHRLTKP